MKAMEPKDQEHHPTAFSCSHMPCHPEALEDIPHRADSDAWPRLVRRPPTLITVPGSQQVAVQKPQRAMKHFQPPCSLRVVRSVGQPNRRFGSYHVVKPNLNDLRSS